MTNASAAGGSPFTWSSTTCIGAATYAAAPAAAGPVPIPSASSQRSIAQADAGSESSSSALTATMKPGPKRWISETT
jgi:hypothetical protein